MSVSDVPSARATASPSFLARFKRFLSTVPGTVQAGLEELRCTMGGGNNALIPVHHHHIVPPSDPRPSPASRHHANADDGRAHARDDGSGAQRDQLGVREKEHRASEGRYSGLKRRRKSQDGAHIAKRSPFARARKFTVGDGRVNTEPKRRRKSHRQESRLLDVDSLFGYERLPQRRYTEGCYRRESFGGVNANAQRRERKDPLMSNNVWITPKRGAVRKRVTLGRRGGMVENMLKRRVDHAVKRRERRIGGGKKIGTHSLDASMETEHLKKVFPEELVEIVVDNPRVANKLFKKHGETVAMWVEMEARKRRREDKIRLLEERVEKFEARREGGSAVDGIGKRLRRLLGIKDDHQADVEEDDTVGEWDVVYWEEDEEDVAEDGDLEQQQDAQENTVLEEGKAFSLITESALKRLRRVLTGSSVIGEINVNGCRIAGADLDRLKPGVWLNDEVVNAYLELLARRTQRTNHQLEQEGKVSNLPNIRVMNSFFYSKLVAYQRRMGCSVYDYTRVRRWTRRFNVFDYDLMLIPINQQNTHWTLGVVDFKEKQIYHLDSMGNGGSERVCGYLLRWLKDEVEDKKKEDMFNEDDWELISRPDVPKQQNSDDCGVFTCKFADWLARGWKRFTFDQRHMDYFRARIAHELLMVKAT